MLASAMSDFATGDVPMQPKGSAAGMPPGKQMQSEESLPALDDEERKAVQMRARDRLNARGSGAKTPTSTRSPGAKTPKSSNRLPGYMTPKTGGTARSSRGAKSSRSSALTWGPILEARRGAARLSPPLGAARQDRRRQTRPSKGL